MASMDLRDEDLAQKIRLLDVFGIGPLMVYAGMVTEDEIPRWARGALVLFGITTIGYNGMNYLSVREDQSLYEDDEWHTKSELAEAYARLKKRVIEGEKD